MDVRGPSGISPHIKARVAESAKAQNALAHDALVELDSSVVKNSKTLVPAGSGRLLPVPVGTKVATGAAHDLEWLVIGNSDNGIEIARRTPEGAIERAVKPLSELVERSPHLMREPLTDARGQRWQITSDAIEGVRHLGRNASVNLAQVGAEHRINTTWGSILDHTKLAERTVIVGRPASTTAIADLRELVGDKHLVVSNVATPYGGSPALIGTDAKPGAGAAQLNEARATQEWFKTHAGIDVWRADQGLIASTDDLRFIGNAAAAYSDGRALTMEGPRSASITASWLDKQPTNVERALRKADKTLARHDIAVRTHEAGHVAHMREWGRMDEVLANSPKVTAAQKTEFGVVQEGFADLFGAARTHKPTVGVRDLKRLQFGMGDLDTLRNTIANAPRENVHFGTQLLTKPMAEHGARYGWDSVAEITGAAVRRIGHDIKGGSQGAVLLPDAATALRDATAVRFGAKSEAVRALEKGWRALGVLR